MTSTYESVHIHKDTSGKLIERGKAEELLKKISSQNSMITFLDIIKCCYDF